MALVDDLGGSIDKVLLSFTSEACISIVDETIGAVREVNLTARSILLKSSGKNYVACVMASVDDLVK